MMKRFAVYIFACITLCPDAHANLYDDMAIPMKTCCDEGYQFARQHDCCDGPFLVSSESRLILSFMCNLMQQECCKDYIRKKSDCEKGIVTSLNTHSCTSSYNTSQVCCQECIKGTSLGAPKDPVACQKQPKRTGLDEILSNDALVKCCEIAAKNWGETTSQGNSNDATLSSLPSLCEKYAPNELCAHHCVSIPGTYRCECNPGFMLMDDGRNCMEVTKISCNHCQHKCNDSGVKVECYCNRGYELMPDKKSCQDIDECQLDQTMCPPDAKCHNFPGSFACILHPNVDYNNKDHQCPPGYIWNNENNACDDFDECALGTHNCSVDYSCYNMKGTYRCDQLTVVVFEQVFDLKNENETSNNNSSIEITTTSTPKSKPSTPKPKGEISRNSSSVRNLEEETSNNNVRSGVTESNNTEPSEKTPKQVITPPASVPHKPIPRLTQPGKIPDRKLPQDTELATTTLSTTAEISPNPRVITVRPSPKSSVNDNTSLINSTSPKNCLAGFAPDESGTCFDIDECETGEANCGPLQICTNLAGGYTCSYPSGHRLIADHECEDINECETGEAKCGPLQICTNLAGNYTCSCPSGHRLIADHECEDINECVTGEAKCRPLQICTNLAGGYTCSCPSGHRLTADRECEDINECEIGYSMCSKHADCVNTIGSYHCQCHSGFRSVPRNDKVCVDIDECIESRPSTLCQHRCNNIWGGYRCSCHRGYRLNHDNSTCSDINECYEFKAKNICIGVCMNEPGSYRCTCPSGYNLLADKKSCMDIDECETGEAPCANATASSTSKDICVNTRGSFKCHRISCPVGYQLEKPNRCSKVDRKCQLNDWVCFHRPMTISYNFITFASNIYIPDGQLKLFTMRGPAWPNAKLKFELRLVNVSGPPSVREKADLHNFLLAQPSALEALLSLVRPLEGPQSIELELFMELYTEEQYGGTAVAKVFIYVSEYEF